jgi:transcriptional regulator with XRE-family HTH domain
MKEIRGEPIEKNPTSKTVWFGGKPINERAIARAQALDQSYVSRVFTGDRTPSIKNARKIAAVLGMGLEDFLEELDKHVAAVKKQNREIIEQHLQRITAEDTEDLRTIERGGIPKPRMPGFRAV